MTLEQARENLPLYVDGELDPQAVADLETQLAESALLRNELARWRALRHCANRVLTAAAVPPSLEESIRTELGRVRLAAARRPLRLFGSITAIAAAVALMFVWSWMRSPSDASFEVAADEFAYIYRHCAVDRSHHTYADVNVKQINAARVTLAGATSFPVLLPDLRDQGFELEGVCPCFRVPEVEVVHAHYRREGANPAVVSVFSINRKVRLKEAGPPVSTRCAGRRHGYEIVSSQDVCVCKWDESANSFAFCSELETDQLRELADGVTTVALRPVHELLAWGN